MEISNISLARTKNNWTATNHSKIKNFLVGFSAINIKKYFNKNKVIWQNIINLKKFYLVYQIFHSSYKYSILFIIFSKIYNNNKEEFILSLFKWKLLD